MAFPLTVIPPTSSRLSPQRFHLHAGAMNALSLLALIRFGNARRGVCLSDEIVVRHSQHRKRWREAWKSLEDTEKPSTCLAV